VSLGTPADFAATFVDVAYKDLVRTDQNGYEKVYGLPMSVDTLALYYNKDQFEDQLPNKGKPSSTWEGIKEDVIALNKEDSSFDRFELSGIAMGRADNISRAVDILYLLFLQHGVEFYNDNISKAIFASKQGGAFDYPAMSALDLYVSFADSDNKYYSWNEFVADANSEEKEIEAFARGDVSMIIGYSYTYDLIMNYINVLNSSGEVAIDEDAVRIAPIPQLYDPNVSSEKRVTYANYFAETVSRNSQNAEIAWEFLVFITKKENLDYYFEKTHKPTSRRDMIEAQKKDPVYGVFASQVGYSESFPVLDYYVYKNIFENVITQANLSGTAGSGLNDAQDTISGMLPAEGILVPKVVEEETEVKPNEE
jgi:ABC-type glycerol-3-phosphate transport system substrate-binding protein